MEWSLLNYHSMREKSAMRLHPTLKVRGLMWRLTGNASLLYVTWEALFFCTLSLGPHADVCPSASAYSTSVPARTPYNCPTKWGDRFNSDQMSERSSASAQGRRWGVLSKGSDNSEVFWDIIDIHTCLHHQSCVRLWEHPFLRKLLSLHYSLVSSRLPNCLWADRGPHCHADRPECHQTEKSHDTLPQGGSHLDVILGNISEICPFSTVWPSYQLQPRCVNGVTTLRMPCFSETSDWNFCVVIFCFHLLRELFSSWGSPYLSSIERDYSRMGHMKPNNMFVLIWYPFKAQLSGALKALLGKWASPADCGSSSLSIGNAGRAERQWGQN